MHLLKCSVSDPLDLKVLFITNPAPYNNHHLQPSLTKAHFLDKHDAFCSKGLKIRAAYLLLTTSKSWIQRTCQKFHSYNISYILTILSSTARNHSRFLQWVNKSRDWHLNKSCLFYEKVCTQIIFFGQHSPNETVTKWENIRKTTKTNYNNLEAEKRNTNFNWLH